MSQLVEVLRAYYVDVGAICFLLIRIWLTRRLTRWQERLLELEEQRLESAVSETWKAACTAYASGEPPTLADLLSKREADFRLK